MQQAPNDLIRYLADVHGWQWSWDGHTRARGLCLFHAERSPSLSVYFNDEEDIHVYCHGGGCGVNADLLGVIWRLEFGGKDDPNAWDMARLRYKEFTGKEYVSRRTRQGQGRRTETAQAAQPSNIIPIRRGILPDPRKARHTEPWMRQLREPTPVEARYLEVCRAYWHEQLFSHTLESQLARDYLISRGIDLAYAATQPRIGYAPGHPNTLYALSERLTPLFGADWIRLGINTGLLTRADDEGRSELRLRFRVMFSCLAADNTIGFYQGRTILADDDRTAKYLNAPTFSKIPYGLPVSSPRREGTLIVEGPVEAVILAQHRLTTVAQLGTDSSIAAMLEQYTGPIFLAHNHDRAHLRATGWYYPGDEMAEELAPVCAYLRLPHHRLRPPASKKDHDRWVRESGIQPLLDAMDALLRGTQLYPLTSVG